LLDFGQGRWLKRRMHDHIAQQAYESLQIGWREFGLKQSCIKVQTRLEFNS
jgi:hypothetical protein